MSSASNRGINDYARRNSREQIHHLVLHDGLMSKRLLFVTITGVHGLLLDQMITHTKSPPINTTCGMSPRMTKT